MGRMNKLRDAKIVKTLNVLLIVITRCNLACRYCYCSLEQMHTMDVEGFITIFNKLDRYFAPNVEFHLVFHGGEPIGQGRAFDKWVVVGHWPVMLYGTDTVCANPIIERERKIISIDGGCVLKDDGQLNALIIPYNGSEDFQVEHYDPFPVRRVKSAQKGSEKSIYIRWGDNIVRILERGREFSRCVHVRSGYELDVVDETAWVRLATGRLKWDQRGHALRSGNLAEGLPDLSSWLPLL